MMYRKNILIVKDNIPVVPWSFLDDFSYPKTTRNDHCIFVLISVDIIVIIIVSDWFIDCHPCAAVLLLSLCLWLRPGVGLVSVVHGPVPQAGLPAPYHRPWWQRVAGRTRCRYADRCSVSHQRRRVCRPRSRLLDRLQPSPHHQHRLQFIRAQHCRRTSSRLICNSHACFCRYIQ